MNFANSSISGIYIYLLKYLYNSNYVNWLFLVLNLIILCLPAILTIDPIIVTYVKFLKDFVKSSTSPKVINAYLCWKKGKTIFITLNMVIYIYLFLDELIYLHRQMPLTMICTLSSFDHYNVILKKRITTAEFRQHEIFVLDFSCSDSLDFLNKVRYKMFLLIVLL